MSKAAKRIVVATLAYALLLVGAWRVRVFVQHHRECDAVTVQMPDGKPARIVDRECAFR